jgi:hypothetical protein
MKQLRILCALVVLTFALTVPAYAGNISTDIAAPPPPPSSSATTDGNISTGITSQTTEGTGETTASASSSITEIAMNLLQSVLVLF